MRRWGEAPIWAPFIALRMAFPAAGMSYAADSNPGRSSLWTKILVSRTGTSAEAAASGGLITWAQDVIEAIAQTAVGKARA